MATLACPRGAALRAGLTAQRSRSGGRHSAMRTAPTTMAPLRLGMLVKGEEMTFTVRALGTKTGATPGSGVTHGLQVLGRARQPHVVRVTVTTAIVTHGAEWGCSTTFLAASASDCVGDTLHLNSMSCLWCRRCQFFANASHTGRHDCANLKQSYIPSWALWGSGAHVHSARQLARQKTSCFRRNHRCMTTAASSTGRVSELANS